MDTDAVFIYIKPPQKYTVYISTVYLWEILHLNLVYVHFEDWNPMCIDTEIKSTLCSGALMICGNDPGRQGKRHSQENGQIKDNSAHSINRGWARAYLEVKHISCNRKPFNKKYFS